MAGAPGAPTGGQEAELSCRTWGSAPCSPGPVVGGLRDLGAGVAEAGSHLVAVTLLSARSSVAVTMFWKFDLSTTSHVDKLLDKEDVTLRELMDEDDILQECKAQNRKLLDFLCRQQSMEELVSLVTQDPALGVEEKVRFKYVPRRWVPGAGQRAGWQRAGLEDGQSRAF